MGNQHQDSGAYDVVDERSRAVVAAPTERKPAPLGYRGAAPQRNQAVPADAETLKSLTIPLWLLGGGVAVEVLAAWFSEATLAAALTSVGVGLIAGTAFMLVGILLAARWRQIDLGSFWNAVLKLAAISVAPAAVVTLASPLLRVVPLGGLLGWLAEFVLYFALLGVLFDLDESDTWYCVWVIFLVRLAVYFTLMGALAKWG